MTKTSREDFAALVRRAKLDLTPTQIDQAHEGWGYVEPMLERIRTPPRGREAEPAHIFRPDVFTTETP